MELEDDSVVLYDNSHDRDKMLSLRKIESFA